jgi:hypothetical protein
MPPMMTSNFPVSRAGMMPDHLVGMNSILDPHVLGQARGHVNFKADELAGLVLHGPGHEGGHAHPQDPALDDLFHDTFRVVSGDGTGDAGQGEKQNCQKNDTGQSCHDSHACAPFLVDRLITCTHGHKQKKGMVLFI